MKKTPLAPLRRLRAGRHIDGHAVVFRHVANEAEAVPEVDADTLDGMADDGLEFDRIEPVPRHQIVKPAENATVGPVDR